MKARILVCCFLMVVLICLPLSFRVDALSPLRLDLIVDKPIYELEYDPPSTINISGNLTLNEIPVSDGLVAVTVFQGTMNRYIRPILFRTIATGQIPPQNWSFSIVSLNVGEWNGSTVVPTTIFKRPSTPVEPGPVFNITYNNVNYKERVYLTLTLFDAESVPITTRIMMLDKIPANLTFSVITDSIPLEDWVALGNATAYVSAFDNIPPYIYFPYCPEVSTQFEVIPNGGAMLSQQKTTSVVGQAASMINGNYNLTFKISYYQAWPMYSPWGNYTVKVSSKYQGQSAINSCTFWVKIPGDLDGDGIVNIMDATLIGLNWLLTVPPGDPKADPNHDGIVNILDATMVGFYWLKYEEP
jgi:hypothetical protein